MPDAGSIKPTPVALFEQDGIESISLVFLTPAAAKNLRDSLEFALVTPDALSRATWPREICSGRRLVPRSESAALCCWSY